MFDTEGVPIRFYQTVTHYGMIEIYHPLHSPQGQKGPFWITPQERQPFPHPIPENLKSEMFPFPCFTIFNSPFHSAVPPSNAQPLHPCQHSVGLTKSFTSGLGPTFRRWNTIKRGLVFCNLFYKKSDIRDIITL